MEDDAALQEPALPIKLGKVPDLHLGPRPPISEVQARKIKSLIAGLANMDKPDFGLSGTMSGDTFAPIPGQTRAGAFILTNHGLESGAEMKELIGLGPDALPFLLEALDDKRPTKLIIRHHGDFGAVRFGHMGFSNELYVNPLNPREAAVYKAGQRAPIGKDPGGSYTVKIGDVCFVAVGQIVGRSYEAIRYQPTSIVVINSPVEDPKLCGDVRSIWNSTSPRKILFETLLRDFVTEGEANENSMAAWLAGSDFQCGAALRLLYYFDKEAAPLVAGRLDKLDYGKRGDGKSRIHRYAANGVRVGHFVNATAWSNAPTIRAALARVFNRAEDVEALLAALPAIEQSEVIRARLEPLIAKLPADEEGPFGDGFHLLVASGQRAPKPARAIFDAYLRDATLQRRRTMCHVFREAKLGWDLDLLAPLLTDKRTFGWSYGVEAGKNEHRRPIRVCDEAAESLSQNHPELKFILAGEHADLDRQIAAIQAQLANKGKPDGS